jgi:hypothetical protein
MSPRPSSRISLPRQVPSPDIAVAVLVIAILLPLAADNGGFSPVAWGWGGLGLAWAGVMALLVRSELRLAAIDVPWILGWLALALWTALGLLWTVDTTRTALEVQRILMYLGVACAFLILCRGRSPMALAYAIWVVTTLISTYGLATHLLPLRFGIYSDPIQPGRLYQPLGYWNGLGIFASMGTLLALGIADSKGRVGGRALAAASIPTLALTMYFTFSRGAWAAAASGIVAVVIVVPHRLRYILTGLAVAPWAAAPVIVSAHSNPLVTSAVKPTSTESAGSHVLLILIPASLICGLAVFGLDRACARLSPPVWARRTFGGGLLCLALLGAGGISVKYGSPAMLTRRVDSAFNSGPTAQPNSGNLTNRLFSLSPHGRVALWRVALHDFEHHPAAGSGAGTFPIYWFQRRPYPLIVQNAHSLYLETAAEMGGIGLAILVGTLFLPLIWAIRVRRQGEILSVSLGAYVAFLVHASFDWDWELPAVTVVGLACGVALLLGARRGGAEVGAYSHVKWPAIAGCIAIGVLSVGGLLGNRSISDAETALGARHWQSALTAARTAAREAPWSEQPYLIAGSAHRGLGARAAAARDFRKAVARSPLDWDAWYSLAATTTGREHAQAISMFRRLNPLA